MPKAIVLTKREHDYHVCLKENTAIWGCGKSYDEAIGDLIRSHADIFDITIEYPKQDQRIASS